MSSLWFTCLPYMAMAVTANLGGWTADHLHGRGMSLTVVRKIVTGVAFSGASAFLLLFSASRSVGIGLVFVTAALSFMSLVTGGLEASYLDVASPAMAGTFKSVGNTLGALSGMLAMPYTSLVLRMTGGSWRLVFASFAVFFTLGTLVFVRFATAERLPLEDLESESHVQTA
jgi:MFS transporter, ACS family, solute carrier family 17 (sodium-dependent inorganic phosphate cotransporter), other